MLLLPWWSSSKFMSVSLPPDSSQGVNIEVQASHWQRSCTSENCVLQAITSIQVWQASGLALFTHLVLNGVVSPRAVLRFCNTMPEHKELVLEALNVNFAKTSIQHLYSDILLLTSYSVERCLWSSKGYDSTWLNYINSVSPREDEWGVMPSYAYTHCSDKITL